MKTAAYPKSLIDSVADLHAQSPWRGFAKTIPNLFLLVACPVVTMRTETPLAFVLCCFATALIYSSIFVTTHDAIHRTLTGVPWFDDVAARLIAYPGLWFHRVYEELHLLHHKMNGNDLADPERPWKTADEYRAMGPWGRWYVRHQWFVDLFLIGGFGFIAHHVSEGLKRYRTSPAMRRAFWEDVAGILIVNGAIYGICAYYGVALKYLAYYLILERLGGVIHQFRSRIEHYGLWGREALPIDTQIVVSRNIRTNPVTSYFFNGLNYHSVHHAFPRIPYYRLAEAHERMRGVLAANGRELKEDESYLRTAWRLARHPVVIGAAGPIPADSPALS